MMIFMKRLIIISIFFAPAQSTDYALKWADFNTGQIVYRNDVQLSTIGDELYKITSSEGEQTFGMWDYVTMVGLNVEFHTDDSQPIRCKFYSLMAAMNLYKHVKPRMYPEIQFSLISTELAFPTGEIHEIIAGGYLGVEIRSRFYIQSEIADMSVINMIFSRDNFNVSSVQTGGRILLVVQLYDIDTQEMYTMNFILTFRDDHVARSFHDYVKDAPSCANDAIPVVFPDNFAP